MLICLWRCFKRSRCFRIDFINMSISLISLSVSHLSLLKFTNYLRFWECCANAVWSGCFTSIINHVLYNLYQIKLVVMWFLCRFVNHVFHKLGPLQMSLIYNLYGVVRLWRRNIFRDRSPLCFLRNFEIDFRFCIQNILNSHIIFFC